MADSRAEAYYQLFQRGGAIPEVFRGARYYSYGGQTGAGIGDFFRGLFRTILPIAISGASTFLGETLRGAQDEGMNFAQAAKAALRPTAISTMSAASKKLQGESQSGGRRRKVRRSRRNRVVATRFPQKKTRNTPWFPQIGGGRRAGRAKKPRDKRKKKMNKRRSRVYKGRKIRANRGRHKKAINSSTPQFQPGPPVKRRRRQIHTPLIF